MASEASSNYYSNEAKDMVKEKIEKGIIHAW
jgi:hypothetical protein